VTIPPYIAESQDEFSELEAELQQQIHTSARLPDWPFRAISGFVTIYEYDRILGSTFGTVLEALSDAYGDDTVTVIGLEPEMAYYRDEYSYFPGLRIARASIRDGYGEGLRREPDGDPTGALAYTVNVVGMVGASGVWSIWGQRDWEIGLLLTPDSSGRWLKAPVPWFDREIDLDSIRSPSGWGVHLSDQERSMFWQNVQDRGSGR
jgi:hypothetical protein